MSEEKQLPDFVMFHTSGRRKCMLSGVPYDPIAGWPVLTGSPRDDYDKDTVFTVLGTQPFRSDVYVLLGPDGKVGYRAMRFFNAVEF